MLEKRHLCRGISCIAAFLWLFIGSLAKGRGVDLVLVFSCAHSATRTTKPLWAWCPFQSFELHLLGLEPLGPLMKANELLIMRAPLAHNHSTILADVVELWGRIGAQFARRWLFDPSPLMIVVADWLLLQEVANR